MAEHGVHPVESLEPKDPRPRAGEVRTFPTGVALYFSAPPMPTGSAPLDLNGNFLEINEVYLDLGSSQHTGFSNQMMFGIPFMGGVIGLGVIAPAFIALVLQNARQGFLELFWMSFPSFFGYGLMLGGAGFLLLMFSFLKRLGGMSREYPMRFNRQRRQVCYVDQQTGKPIIVSWEEVVAWAAESTGATQYGVHRHANLGLAVQDPETGDVHTVLFNTFGLQDTMAMWEGLWQFMEFGPERLRGLLAAKGDDPRARLPHDSPETFDFEREQMHKEYRQGQRGPVSVFFWYVSRVLSFWKLPYRISAWEYRRARPPVIAEREQWSKPLPEEQHAKPSKALAQAVDKMIAAYNRDPDTPYSKLCEEAFAGIPEFQIGP